MSKPFWKRLKLDQLDSEQWEQLCDGCGLCCLHKLEDMDDGEIYYTSVACRLLDLKTCRCADYANRLAQVPDCVVLTPQKVEEISWLPGTCAYRLMAIGQPLPSWHPLEAGNSVALRRAGISACSFAIAERDADLDDLEQYVID